MQGFASAVFKHKAALRKQSGAAQAAGKNILFACLSMLLYHRGASFTMNTACTKPVQYPTETQLNLYKPVTFLPHLSAFGVWESFRAVSKARRDFFTRISLFFRNPCASLCGQTFDTPFPLSLFLSAERYGRRKQYGNRIYPLGFPYGYCGSLFGNSFAPVPVFPKRLMLYCS